MIVEGLSRLLLKGAQKVGLHTWVLLTCLAIFLTSVAIGLSNILFGLESLYLSTIVILALAFSWLLARSSSPGWLAGMILSLSGAVIILMSAGGLSTPFYALARSLGQFSRQVIYWQWNSPFPDPKQIFQLAQEAGGALGNLAADTLGWIQALLNRRPVFDRQAATLAWSALLWGASCWAGWMVRRRGNPVLAALPGAALLAASLSYTRANALYLFPILFSALALKAWHTYSQREINWVRTDTDFAEDLRFDSGMWSLAFIVMVIMPALLLSNFSPQKSIQLAQRLLLPERQAAQQVGTALGLQTNSQNGAVPINPGILPREHLLGAGPELSQQVVMMVETSGSQFTPCNTGPCEPLTPRLYWRSVNYDIYTGSGWATSATSRQNYPKNRPARSLPAEVFQNIRQEIQMVETTDRSVHYAGTVLSADQDYQVEWRDDPEREDAYGVQLLRPPRTGSYEAVSAIPLIAESQLLLSPPDYPEWISEVYLQLPESLPGRVRDLAQTLTAGFPTTYERALAIEEFLRAVPYTLDVPEPPPGRDVVDFYLFDLREGYCDYSASAMVVLARAAGIPARLVMGYAAGQLDPQTNTYVVTAAEAHSWAELYFPGTGWVEFEPTSGQPALTRPEEMPTSPAAGSEQIGLTGQTTDVPTWQQVLLAIGGLAGLLLLAFYAWPALDAWRMDRLAGSQAAALLYQRLHQWAARLGLSYQLGETPAEYAQILGREMSRLSRNTGSHFIRSAPVELIRLATYYERATYSQHSLDAKAREDLVSIWRRLRRAFWTAWLMRKWKSLRST